MIGEKTIELSKISLTKSTDQTIAADNTFYDITFDGESIDTDNLHDNTTNNERITIKNKGYYILHYQIKIDMMDKMSAESRILKNGSDIIHGTCSIVVGSKDTSFMCINVISPIIEAEPDDYYVLQIKHDDDSTKDIIALNTYLAMRELL